MASNKMTLHLSQLIGAHILDDEREFVIRGACEEDRDTQELLAWYRTQEEINDYCRLHPLPPPLKMWRGLDHILTEGWAHE